MLALDQVIYAKMKRAFGRVHYLLGKMSRRHAEPAEPTNQDDSAEF